MPNDDYITRADLDRAIAAKVAIMEFERRAGNPWPQAVVYIDSPVAWQTATKALGLKPVDASQDGDRYVHRYVETPEGVRFWHSTMRGQ